MSDVQTQVLAITKLKPKADETAEDFTLRAVKKLHGSTDQEWEALPDPVQAWVNDNMVANEAGTPLELLELPEAETKVDEPDEQEVEAEAEPEEEAGAEVNEGEQESVVEVKSAKKANGKKPAVKTPKVKAPKVTKVAKSAKAKGTDPRGRKPLFGPDQKIKLLVPENPHRSGTKLHTMFKRYKEGMTIEAAVKAGAPYSNIRYLVGAGHIKVA